MDMRDDSTLHLDINSSKKVGEKSTGKKVREKKVRGGLNTGKKVQGKNTRKNTGKKVSFYCCSAFHIIRILDFIDKMFYYNITIVFTYLK